MRKSQGIWANTPLQHRLRHVSQLRHLLARDAMELALTATQDIERTATEVLATDVLPTADACYFLERHARRILAPKHLRRAMRPFWLFGTKEVVHRLPWGIVGMIGTWNYPIILNLVPIIQALTAGNAVIWKPSELTPTVARKITQLLAEAGFPTDLIHVMPATREGGPELVEADLDHLVFTGSESAGIKIARRLAERLIPSTLELSGCDAMIVHADANLALAAKAAWYGIMLNHGQTCLAIRRILVDHRVYTAFIQQLKEQAPKHQPETLALWSQATQAERLVQNAINLGGKLLDDAVPHASNDPPRFPPTIVIDASPQMSICQEASFAPIAAVMSFSDFADAYSIWNACEFQLTASIFTQDQKNVEAWATKLTVSTICWNDLIMPTAHPAVSFGGRKHAGWGQTRGIEGLLNMTTPQTLLLRSGTFRPHYNPDNPGTVEIINGILQWKHAATLKQRWNGFKQMLGGMWKGRKET